MILIIKITEAMVHITTVIRHDVGIIIRMIMNLTLGGPMIVPVHFDMTMSSSSSRPQLILPSPNPFMPSSSSSSKRKFLGTEKKITLNISYSHNSTRKEVQN